MCAILILLRDRELAGMGVMGYCEIKPRCLGMSGDIYSEIGWIAMGWFHPIHRNAADAK